MMTSRPVPELTERPWRPVPGPADRETFFAAQARNRRTTWRLTALCLMGVALMGIPISAILTPLLLAALFLIGDLVILLLPLSTGCRPSRPATGSPEPAGCPMQRRRW